MARPPRKPHYDIDQVRNYASGRWSEILNSVGGLPSDVLDGDHHPCPKCGGTDRFRFTDQDGSGSLICNQCIKAGDGFAAVQWAKGVKFGDSLQLVADYLGIHPSKNGSVKRKKSNPADHLEFLPWNETLVELWCGIKRPITPRAVQLAHGRLARYYGQYTVLAFPVWGSKLNQADPVGWCVYSVFGKPLPKYKKDKSVSWVAAGKPKLTAGSEPGLIGPMDLIQSAETIWKVEGPSDMLGMLSLELPDGIIAITNANGAGEWPAPWMADLFAGKIGRLVHDADVPGENGAKKWTNFLAPKSSEFRWVKLPYEVAADHGKDLRDYLSELYTYWDLDELANASAPIATNDVNQPRPDEADDDPHRLARMNLEQYASRRGGRTLVYWRDEWYVWRGTNYRRITEKELRAKITQSCKYEFDRTYLARKADGTAGEDEKTVRRVTTSLVTNVLQATAGMTVLSSFVEPMTWLPTREQKNYVAMRNGILDMDAAIEDRDDYLIPHSPDWFSTVCLPYEFDADATCPKWEAFLERNLEMDPERIKLLQEWAGYLLLPDTGQQKFLVLEGEGANGKSVFCAAIEAMLGIQNVSHVPLEVFGEKFELTATLDRLANVCGDAGELDKVAEGHIKAFTAGNPMTFGRKYLDSVERVPTARLMMAVNNRPRFSDRSDGVWRRMLLVPWRIQIPSNERIPNMDKPWYWEQSGELPGILLWAIAGLHRLQQQSQFTRSELCEEALQDYRSEMNPARTFLAEHIEESVSSRIKCNQLYDFYVRWSKQSGHHPLAERQFGREIFRLFRKCKKSRSGASRDRTYFYQGISFSCDEICGEKTNEALLF
jgi:P4 family phage/plasmid primase-like protien